MILAIDTETTGVDFWHGCRPFMVTMCDGDNNYAWTGTVNPYNRMEVTWNKDDLDEIQYLIDHADLLLFHNAKFDIRALETIGVDAAFWEKVQDTMLASHVVCSGESHALKYLAYKYLDYENEGEQLLAKAVQAARTAHPEYDLARHSHPSFPGIPAAGQKWYKMDYWLCPDECLKYGTDDVEMTWLLWRLFANVMDREDLMEQYKTRCWLLPITYEMEREGLYIYKDEVDHEIRIQRAIQRAMQEGIREELCLKFPLDFQKKEDLRCFLFELLKLPVLEKSDKTGSPLMNKDVIERYISSNPKCLPLSHYRDYVQAGTKISYLESYLKWIAEPTPFSSTPTAIHANFFITGTRETRQSVTSPNTQNIDKRLRHIFGPPPGYVWLDYDLVSIEPRIWAYLTGNQELIEVLENGGSPHLLFSSIVYPEEYKEYKESFKVKFEYTLYGYVKAGGLSLMYGAGEYRADHTFKKIGAYDLISKRMPEIPYFSAKTIREAEENLLYRDAPYVTCVGGYRLDVDMSVPHKACNYKIQGSAGFIINKAMINVVQNPLYKKTQSQIVNQVHDSIVIQVPEAHNSLSLQESLKESIEAAGLEYLPTCEASYDVIENTQAPF